MLAERSSRSLAPALVVAALALAATLAPYPSATAASATDSNVRTSVSALHLRLVRARPGVDSTYAGSPAAISLWFSEKVNPKTTAVTMTDKAGRVVKLGPLSRDTAAKAPVVAKVLQTVAPGQYTVAWRAVGRDGHVVKNKYGFTVVAAKAGPGK